MEKVYRNTRIPRMSTKNMADFLYAILMTNSELTNSWHMGHKYDRTQNTYNGAYIVIGIEEDKITLFEKLSGVKLEIPPKISLNSN